MDIKFLTEYNSIMRIGVLAVWASMIAWTICYYEDLGTLEPKNRPEGRFRLYSEAHQRRFLIVGVLKGLGFDLKCIRDLLLLKTRSAAGGEFADSLMEHLD